MTRSADPLGVAFVVLAAIGFGTLGPLAQFAADAGFTTVSFAIWRALASAVALAVLLAIGVLAGRIPTTPWSAVPRLERLQLAAMGLFVAGTTLALFSAFERIGVSLSLIVFYTFPIMVALAAVPLYGEHLGRHRVAAISLASFGLVLLMVSPGASGTAVEVDALGLLFALVAAVCQVGYALVGARGFASVPAFQSATILRSFSVLFYVLVLVPLVIVLGDASTLTEPIGSAQAYSLILVAGIIGAAIPTALLVAGYRRVGPTRGAVLMLVEPVTGVLLATLLLAEQPSPSQLAGGVLVLAGAALVQLARGTRTRVEAPPAAE